MKKVLIVGGGIAGLSAALALRKSGIAVDLVEVNKEWTVHHDGIVMPESTLRVMVQEAGVTVRLGVSFVEMRDLGRAVGVRFSDGTSGGYDLVVGADGAYSKVREVLFGNAYQPTFAGRGVNAVFVPSPWYKGRVVLIGDAVHAITPDPGQGAAQAMEDGIVLGEVCAERMPVEEMLATFMSRRYERCRLIHEGSLQIGEWEQRSVPETGGAQPIPAG